MADTMIQTKSSAIGTCQKGVLCQAVCHPSEWYLDSHAASLSWWRLPHGFPACGDEKVPALGQPYHEAAYIEATDLAHAIVSAHGQEECQRTWLVGFEGPLLHGVDNVGHSNVCMQASVIGHLGLLDVGTVANGVNVAVTFHLEELVHFQSPVAGQPTLC